MKDFVQSVDKLVGKYDTLIQNFNSEKDSIQVNLDERLIKETKLSAISTVISDQIHSSYTQSIEKICEVITACIEAVYDRSFEFAIITSPDGKSKPVILEHTTKTKTITYENISQDLGDGLKDVVMFGLHVMQWAFNPDKTRNTLILDEPFSGLGVLSYRISPIIQELCKDMGLQIIMTTHNALTAQNADKIIVTEYKDKQTVVSEASFEEAERLMAS
jgi:ABC-type glutathione transport system ATPase component